MAKKLTWWEAAEIIGVTDQTMRRWRERLEVGGYAELDFVGSIKTGRTDAIEMEPSSALGISQPRPGVRPSLGDLVMIVSARWR